MGGPAGGGGFAHLLSEYHILSGAKAPLGSCLASDKDWKEYPDTKGTMNRSKKRAVSCKRIDAVA